MDKIPAYILAGGDSTRFGRDKARVELEGIPLIVRVADSLRPVASSVTVIADRADKYSDFDLVTIADLRPGLGPLGGIQTALAHRAEPGWLLCASCDRIGIRTDWLQSLLAGAGTGGDGIVAFRGELWQPLPALYHTSIISEVNKALGSGVLAPFRMFELVQSVALPLPAGWERSLDINDPDALRQYLAGG